jgi:23S rRNA (adenine2503-C2)-methyltransferase
MTETTLETRTDLLDLTLPELEARLEAWGEKPFRARQIHEWIYRRGAADFEAMENLPPSLRALLAESARIALPEVVETREDPDAEKFALRLADGVMVESVRIKGREESTFCLSTQAGCDLSCRFCASGKVAFQRNLSAGEIVGQALLLDRLRGRPGNLVYMGMGEPFLNYAATMKSLEILQDSQGYRFGARRITVSTAGGVPEIYRFAREAGQVNLALSLHAASDAKRQDLMPVARLYNLRQLMDAAWDYTEVTGRRISFEYVRIREVNDSRHDAERLAQLLKNRLAHVNLIPFNPIEGSEFKRPSKKDVERFVGDLQRGGVNVTVRHSAGVTVAAACGQLAGKLTEQL